MKQLIYIFLISAIITSCKSKVDKKALEIQKESFSMLIDATTKLLERQLITQDSARKIQDYFAAISNTETAVKYAKHYDSLSKLPLTILITKKSNSEYIDYFQNKYSQIKLEKLFGEAPLYNEYAKSLMAFMEEIIQTDETYQVLSIPKVKVLYNKAESANKNALIKFSKYGEPDKDLVEITSICEATLKNHLNDPDYELVKEKYFLKQTKDGYKYKLLIRAKNSFGAKIMKEIAFNLKYKPVEEEYYVSSIQQ